MSERRTHSAVFTFYDMKRVEIEGNSGVGATASRICRHTELEACVPLTATHDNHGSREEKFKGKLGKCRRNPQTQLLVFVLLRRQRKLKTHNILTQEDCFRLWTPCPSEAGAGILHRIKKREASCFSTREAASLTVLRDSTALTQPSARSLPC